MSLYSTLELGERPERVIGIAQTGQAPTPKECQLLDVLLEYVRDERKVRHLPSPVFHAQLIDTAPPLMRFIRLAWETRSLPLINIFPSSRIVIDPSPTFRVRFFRACRTSSSGT